jgi:alpha-L-fucosidase 2
MRFGLIFLCLFVSQAWAVPLKLWYEQPASAWMQAAPLGNGRLGAMIYGGVETETLALNEISLWSGQYDENQEIPCGKDILAKIRKLYFEGKMDEGNDLANRFLSGTPHSFGTHLPVGDLKISTKHTGAISGYRRELDMETAVASVSYKAGNIPYRREYFCSNPDDVLLIRLTAGAKNALSFEISLDLLRESDIRVSGNRLTFSGQALFPKQGPGGVQYEGTVQISVKGGKILAHDHTLSVENSNEALIIVDFRTDFKNSGYKETGNQAIQAAASKTYSELKQAHIKDYQRLFNRVQLDLGKSEADRLPTDIRWQQMKKERNDDPGLFALFFQYGRYLLIASSRENSPLPANLQGLWNDNLACNMGWTCDYHLDINTEQNYWLANTGNLPECNAPLFQYLDDLSRYGEKTARDVYGCRGWTAHTVANVWGYTAPGQGTGWGLFPTAGAWLASHLWNHYCFTADKRFLEKQGYPILKKCAEFLLDYLVEDPRNGYLMTGPSTSPENSFKTGGREYNLSLTPTCDRVLVYETFASCIEASRILNIDEAFRRTLEQAQAKLPPIQTGKDGTVREWFEDYELGHPEHRHSSHLLALYPFNQISVEKTPELAAAAAKSIYRQTNAEHYEDVEWSRANMICFYARLKKAEEAYKNVKGLLVEFSRENLFTMAPAGVAGANEDIFEFDANEAAPAGIAEMLLQSHEGYIELLPALPREWNTGSFKGLCVRGGAEVDLKWEKGQVKHAKITATADNTFSIQLPETTVKIRKNNKVIQPQKTDANRISVELKKGEYIEL